MTTPPKLPTRLPLAQLSELTPALAIEAVKVERANWSGQIARRVTFDSASLVEADLTAAQLRESGWSDVAVTGGEFGGLDLLGAAWRRVRVDRGRLSGIILAEAELKDVRFEDAKLDVANFRFAKLAQCEFVRCNLRDADFAGAQLNEVKFIDCDITGGSFAGTRMKSVDLQSTHLENLNGIGGLSGATLSRTQIIELAPELAAALGIIEHHD